MGFFSNLTSWLYNTGFYQKYMSNWPAPLNDASFDMFLVMVIAVLVVIPEIKDKISNHLAHLRMKEKQRELAEKRLDEELAKKRENENNQLMDQYIKFMMIASMKQVGMDVSFDEWKAARKASGITSSALQKETTSTESAEDGKKRMSLSDAFDAVKETIADKIPVRKEEILTESHDAEEPDEKVISSVSFDEELPATEAEPVAAEDISDKQVVAEAAETKEEISVSSPEENMDEPEVVITEEEILNPTKMEELPEEKKKTVVLPISLKEEDSPVKEKEEDKELFDINSILSKKGEETGTIPVQIGKQDMDGFELIMDNLRHDQNIHEKTEELEKQKAETIEKNKKILNTRLAKDYVQEETKIQSKVSSDNRDVDEAKSEASKLKEKERIKAERAAKRAAEKQARLEAKAAKRNKRAQTGSEAT